MPGSRDAVAKPAVIVFTSLGPVLLVETGETESQEAFVLTVKVMVLVSQAESGTKPTMVLAPRSTAADKDELPLDVSVQDTLSRWDEKICEIGKKIRSKDETLLRFPSRTGKFKPPQTWAACFQAVAILL